MANIAKLSVVLTAEGSGVTKGVDAAKKDLGKLKDTVKGGAGSGGGGFTDALGGGAGGAASKIGAAVPAVGAVAAVAAKLKAELGPLGDGIEYLASSFGLISTPSRIAGLALSAFRTVLNETVAGINRISEIGRAAAQLNIHASDMRLMQVAAGRETDALSGALAKFQSRVQESALATRGADLGIAGLGESTSATASLMRESAAAMSMQSQAYEVLGLKARDLVRLPVPEQMERVAEALSGVQSAAAKTFVTRDLFGKNYAEMMETLGRGSGGIARSRRLMDQLGLSVSDADVANIRSIGRSLDTLKMARQGLQTQLGIGVGAILGELGDRFGNMLDGMGVKMTGLADLVIQGAHLIAASVAGAIDSFSPHLPYVVAWGQEIVNVFLNIADTVWGAFKFIGDKLLETIRTAVNAAAAIAPGGNAMRDAFESAVGSLGDADGAIDGVLAGVRKRWEAFSKTALADSFSGAGKANAMTAVDQFFLDVQNRRFGKPRNHFDDMAEWLQQVRRFAQAAADPLDQMNAKILEAQTLFAGRQLSDAQQKLWDRSNAAALSSAAGAYGLTERKTAGAALANTTAAYSAATQYQQFGQTQSVPDLLRQILGMAQQQRDAQQSVGRQFREALESLVVPGRM